jgi:hypothetical protein
MEKSSRNAVRSAEFFVATVVSMKRRQPIGFFIVVAALILGGGALFATRWQETLTLRSELELARMETAEWERLKAENQRLREKQIPPAELERLRADHVALPRLRAELEALKKTDR